MIRVAGLAAHDGFLRSIANSWPIDWKRPAFQDKLGGCSRLGFPTIPQFYIGVMKYLFTFLLAITSFCATSQAAEQPNVLIILADDLGYSDLGCYGSQIETPNLDSLASDGLRFTQFYNTARCWPTRAALMTGYYAQQVRRDTLPEIQSGSRGTRPEWAPLLPTLLSPLGYRSYHSGKWHIDGMPVASGFDRSYYLQDTGRFFNPKVHYLNDEKLPEVEPGTDFYVTSAIADHAIEFLQEHAEQHADQPFMQYLAFTSPHFPLHAKPEDFARYRDKFKDGWNEARQQRLERMHARGIVDVPLSEVELEVGPPYHFPEALETLGPGEVNRPLPWSELTDEQREYQSIKMALHAAMIDRMDRDIGRVLDQLRVMDAFDNTLIIFLSDNGASAEIMVRDDGHDPNAAPGSAATYFCLGPGWSNAANTPFRRHKTWVHEGGISTPLVVHWPEGIKAKGELRRNPGHAIDIVPTVLEAVGGTRPETIDGKPVPQPPGKSLVPAFAEDGTVNHDSLWWLHEGNRAIRVGDWKLVAAKDEPWELFDLSIDRSERDNLAEDYPDKVRELAALWEQQTAEITELASADQPPEQAAKEKKKPVKELILPGKSFMVAGRPAFVMQPSGKPKAKPRPWIMYAPTLPAYPDSHEKWMHEQFLAAGIAVAGIDVGEAYGSPKGREYFDALYREMTEKRGYSKKPCLLGRSRGGLWVSSWAIENPDKVAGIAGIYPVFDLRTYPGLEKAAPAYDMSATELEATLVKHNPIQRVATLAAEKIPVFFIHGDIDEVVPLKENSAAFVEQYKTAGLPSLAELIVVEGQGHNFWEGFFHCQELVNFAIARARAGAEKE